MYGIVCWMVGLLRNMQFSDDIMQNITEAANQLEIAAEKIKLPLDKIENS